MRRYRHHSRRPAKKRKRPRRFMLLAIFAGIILSLGILYTISISHHATKRLHYVFLLDAISDTAIDGFYQMMEHVQGSNINPITQTQPGDYQDISFKVFTASMTEFNEPMGVDFSESKAQPEDRERSSRNFISELKAARKQRFVNQRILHNLKEILQTVNDASDNTYYKIIIVSNLSEASGPQLDDDPQRKCWALGCFRFRDGSNNFQPAELKAAKAQLAQPDSWINTTLLSSYDHNRILQILVAAGRCKIEVYCQRLHTSPSVLEDSYESQTEQFWQAVFGRLKIPCDNPTGYRDFDYQDYPYF